MNIKILLYIIILFLIITIFGGFIALRNLNRGITIEETRTVIVKKTDSGFQLFRNGAPFVIKGAGGESHFKELAEIGGNTIRIFDTSNLQNKLDEAHKNNLAVIVDLYLPPYNKSYNLYDNKDENEILKQKIEDLVYQHKDHPALLIWNLGNEINYPFVFRKNDFIKIFNELVSIIQTIDPNHPVSTSIIGVGRKTMSSIFIHSPELDLISFNTFGNTKYVNSNLAQMSFLFGSKPYFFSELGPDGPWESNTTSWGAPIEATCSVKSELYRTRLDFIKESQEVANLGSLVFYWGSKLERSHTWFSLFKGGYKSEIINVIEVIWKELDEEPKTSGLNYMLVNNEGSYDNIILPPGELNEAEIIFHENNVDNARIEWEIYPEAWYREDSEIVLDNYKAIESFVAFENNKTRFLSPGEEGPYRLFAYVYNEDGTFATTNTPFYVLENK